MKNFLRVAALAICAIFMTANANAQGTYDQATMGAKVVEMETASWGQNSPFNNYCWSEYGGSTHAKAGCVPVAFAIVMRYHGFPAEGTSSTLYNCQASTYVEITDRVYDFSKMPLTNGSGWTTEQQNEVAKLISHLGHAFGVSYGVSQTSVSIGDSQTERLTKYFNYKAASATSQYPSNNNLESWKQKIKESLNNGCPVPYAANNTGTGDSRHMFVIDGYTSNDYFHFNFGWNGSGNGWFKLDNITPAQGDNYSWSDDSDGYTSKHQAFFNLMPNKTPRTVTATTNSSSMGTVSINGGTAGNSVSAEVTEGTKATLTAHPADGYALANWTKNGVIVGTKNPIQVTVGESGNDYVANFDDAANVQIEKTCTFNISSVTTSGVSGSYCSTWTTSDGIVLNCTKGSEPAYALSTTVNTFFAKAPVGNSETSVSDITYTLTAPEGYVIKSYSFRGASPSSSYTIDVTIGGNTTNVTKTDEGVVFSASDINSRSTSFVLGSTYTGRAGLSIKGDGVTVTIVSEGGASTPTPEPEPEPEPTPTTYTVTTTANPANGGTAKFAVGTGSQNTQGDVESGTQITLYAVANTGYNFINWTLNGAAVSTSATCNVNVSQAANYVANFEANTPAEPTTSLAGKFFRIKVYNDNRYMNVKNHTEHAQKVTAGGVNIAAKVEDSNAQIFFFEQSGNGYMLKDGDGYYIKGLEWSVDASSTTIGSVLLFEETAIEDVYYIKWNNTYKGDERYFKVGADSNGAGDHPYCDVAANQKETAAAKWVLEEVIPSLNLTFADVTYTNYAGNTINSGWGYKAVVNTTPTVTIKVDGITNNNLGWTTKVNGNKTPYLAKATNFTISIPEPYKIAGYSMTIRGEGDSFSGDVTYTATNNNTGTIAISGTTEKTISATGLETNTINIGVGGTSGNGIFITALEITYIKEQSVPVMFKAEVENWRDNNPNTHLGTITINETQIKVTLEHRTASAIEMPLTAGTTLAFTRKYRGFEFQGFYIGATELGTNPTLTAENVAAISETTPLVAKFTATDDVTLFYDDATYSYRIPAIAKTGTNRLVAISDYRHNLDDIGRDRFGTGKLRIDLVMRTSDDNGATWSDIKTIAAGDDSKVGSYLRAFGDAAVAAVGNNIVVMAAAGDVLYTNGTTSSPNKMARIYSTDNGANWTIEEMTTKMYSTATSLIPDGGSAFFGSGKLAVDPNFNGTGNARIYGALLVRIGTNGYNNFGVFSDDLGATWKILGGSTSPVASGDEPKIEILPNGQILLSARRVGGRVFRVFTYGNDKANGEGSWGDAAVNGCDNGGQNGTNGEIICLDAKRPNGKRTKILLQSQPQGGTGQYDRNNVTIWYKEVSANETYTPSTIASGWTKGKQVSTVQSAYSAMCLQENGEIALFFEEAPCYADNYEKGYSMVYVPLTIEEITNNNFLNPNADVEYVPVEFNIELTDTEGNIYRETLDYVPNDAAAVATYLTTTYPFITLGENGVKTENGYTNTVTLPFKVSNANTTVWHNIYFPANGTSAGEYYPIYLMAENENATAVAKITEKVHYGNSQYNTYNYADKLAWAVYNVNEGFTFKFKNKLTGKFMAVTGVSSDNTNNVVYTDEAGATAFTLEKYTGGNASYGNYAIKSVYNSTTGYVCNTSVGYTYATNYPGTGHAGAWVKFVESPDYWTIYNQLIADIDNFGAGEGKYTANDAISSIDKDALATMPINSLNTKAEEVQNVKESYREVVLTVNDTETATVPGSVSITVNGSEAETVNNKFVPANATVSILATANPGYRFVNWTRPAAQASAAARTAEARNSDVVITDNPYTVTVSEALSLVANFEKKIVNVTLRDDTNENIEAAKRHVYEFVLDNLEGEATTDAIAAKLMEKYPVIESLGSGTNTTLIDNGTSYTYTNSVKLQFLIANGRDDDGITWYNIYYPVNINNQPNYLSASPSESTYVEKINDNTYAYGDNPTYNKESGNAPISWAIYSVDHTLTFALKNKVADKFIQVTSIADENAQNAVFTNEENATAFAISKKTINPVDYYAFAAEINGTTGYLSSTDNNYDYATLFNSNDNPGAWAIVEDPAYYTQYIELLWGLWEWFAPVDGLCTVTKEIQDIKDALNDYENITLNTLKNYGLILEAANLTWPTITLDIKPNKDCGATNINGEEGMTSRRAPADYVFPVEAIPAEGYHFTKWTDATDNTLSTDAKYFTSISGKTGDVTTITANFEINIYTINVTAGEGGSASASAATVEHGSEVTLTAIANDGYEFAGWYNGEELVSNEANYTIDRVTSDINYTARFNEKGQTTYAIHVTVASTDGTTVTNNATGNVKAVVELDGQDWVTDYDCPVGSNVKLIATNDYDSKAYLFDGWYKNDVLVSNELEITVKVTEAATYEARFFRGCIVIGEPKSSSKGYVTKITLADGTSLGYDASNRAVVKPGTTVKINTYIEKEYEVGSWTDEGGNVVGNDKDLIIVIHNDATYTANIESAFYYLTVRANDDNYGTAEVILGTAAPATTVKVNKNMSATITATANNGYYFVNWTKGYEVVSTSATYEIAGIANVENLIDVEYVANFLPVENAVAGVYYRIGYDFPVAAAAGAARAATDETLTYVISPTTGTPNAAGTFNSSWTYTKNGAYQADLTMVSTSNGKAVDKINTMNSGTQHSLCAYYKTDGVVYGITYTVAVPENGNYKITGYSIGYTAYQNVTVNSTATNNGKTGSIQASGLDVNSFDFTVTSTSSSGAIDISNFEVYIQKVGGEETPETPETPANRYYIQSVASGVTNKANALLMTQETGAASIFYYADSKLLSYDKGTYVKEDGTTRGLQAVGASGTVTITTTGETATIAAPSYLHAVDGTTRYVDHCSRNDGTHAHASHNFVLEEVTTLPVTISSALHATFYAPVAVAIPEGVMAYVLKAEDIPGIETYAWMTSLKNGIIPANTGVILRSDEAKIYYFDIVDNNDDARAEAVGNVLDGTVAKTKITEDAYILANRNGKVGLYPVAKNSYLDNNTNATTVRFTNNSHKAYLPVTNDWFGELLKKGTGFHFVFDDDNTTNLEEVKGENGEVKTIYDLQGRKLSEITEPGIYIVGGKKVWVK